MTTSTAISRMLINFILEADVCDNVLMKRVPLIGYSPQSTVYAARIIVQRYKQLLVIKSVLALISEASLAGLK